MFFLFLLCYPFEVTHAQAVWTIEKFDAMIEIHEEAMITVTETIDVVFTEPRHGIYREIPLRYKDTWGNSIRSQLEILSVSHNGERATSTLTWGREYLEIRIGDPEKTIQGPHRYTITYEVDRSLLYFDAYDELYWNVTGSNWAALMQDVSATVILPQGAQVTQTACYTGAYGSTRQNCEIESTSTGVVVSAQDFLTIAVGFTPNIIYEPTLFEKMIWFLRDNWYGLPAVVLLILTIGYWIAHGRDPRIHKSIVAQYEPPKKIKAVYAGVLCKDAVRKEHISAMIIQMAVDGYLTIEVQSLDAKGKKWAKPKIILTPRKKPEGLDAAHAIVYRMLFSGIMKPVDLDSRAHKISASALNTLHNTIKKTLIKEGYYAKRSFSRQAQTMSFGTIVIIISAFIAVFLGWFSGILACMCGLGIVIVGYYMPKLTREGLEIKYQICGFQNFMYTAQRYRSVWQEKEHIFSDYLPYAIAFANVKQWAKAFKGIHQAAPEWYSGAWMLIDLAAQGQLNQITHAVEQAVAVAKPSSTGGSLGGGSSGGGFGGGGGNSW